jgi:hypothetical protein
MYYTTKLYLLITFCTGVLILQGCSSSDPYPGEWNILPFDTAGSGISGKYYNHGINIYGVRKNISLENFILGYYGEIDFKFVKVTVENKQKITFKFYNDSNNFKNRTFRLIDEKMEFTEDGIEIKLDKEVRAEGQGSATTWSSLILNISKDGSLIACYDADSFGLLMMVPIYETCTRWFKFGKVKD